MTSVLDHGATGDGVSLDTGAFQHAVDAVAAAGGGPLSVPRGRYRLGGVVLRSGVHLRLDAGAVLVASADYDDFRTHQAVTVAEESRHAMLYARDATDVAILGPGSIDGSGRAYAPNEPDEHGYREPALRRPRIVLLEGCTDVRVEGLRISDAPMWTVHLAACRRAVVRDLVIENSMTLPNTDGVDVDGCEDVLVAGCRIAGADDAICLKTTRKPEPYRRSTRRVVVTGCTLASRSCALKIGTETHDEVAEVTVTGLVIGPANRAVGLVSRDGGAIRDVVVADVTVATELPPESFWGRGEPVHVSALPRVPGRPPGVVERVRITGLRGTCEGPVHLHAWRKGAVRDVLLDDVRLRQVVSASPLQGELDLRPPVNPDAPDGAGRDNAYRHGPDGLFGVSRPAAGLPSLLATGVAHLELRDVAVDRPEPLPTGWDPRWLVAQPAPADAPGTTA